MEAKQPKSEPIPIPYAYLKQYGRRKPFDDTKDCHNLWYDEDIGDDYDNIDNYDFSPDYGKNVDWNQLRKQCFKQTNDNDYTNYYDLTYSP